MHTRCNTLHLKYAMKITGEKMKDEGMSTRYFRNIITYFWKKVLNVHNFLQTILIKHKTINGIDKHH